MAIAMTDAQLHLDRDRFRQSYDRAPLGFSHNLARLDLFSSESLSRLAERYDSHPDDYFVAASAPSPASEFYSVQHDRYTPGRAMRRLDAEPLRILLKRPEDHDPRFRNLLDVLFQQTTELRGGLNGERIVRLESGIFISSAAATTPFHFDPEIAFFSQIEGEKEYHVYEPEVLSETELERFYVCDMIDIGQVELAGRDPAREHVFALRAGDGLHQPQNAPHWVVTRNSRSISYTFVYATEAGHALGRSRCCNHYVRKLGIEPQRPGLHPARDRAKAQVMSALLPMRKSLRHLLGRDHAS